MSDQAVLAQNLSKSYRIGKRQERTGGRARRTLSNSFGYLASSLRPPTDDETLWAIRDVSFEINEGEVVGIVGHNGAGKSTLLKVLSRITDPTAGRARIHGRVGSLLEVGTGFHPELTGRENIFLNGAILGMRRTEIEDKFDEIVAFSGVERFLDTPVKRYSSGMYVRLAFSVAAHLQPEVLLVDEVLAVGDGEFQKKCLGKMGDVAKEGRTVLFVSHNMIAVQNLCTRAIWLRGGQVHGDGPTSQIIANYMAYSFAAQTERSWPDPASAPGNDKVRIRRLAVRPAEDTVEDALTRDTPLLVEVDYWNMKPEARLHVCLHLYNEQQIVAFTTASIETDQVTDKPLPAGLLRSVCHIPAGLLNSGVHRIKLLVLENAHRITYQDEDALSFEILDLERRALTWYGKEPGVVRPRLQWETTVLAGSAEDASLAPANGAY